MNIVGILVAIAFTAIHFISPDFRVKFFSVRQFTSLISGISIAYVFFHLIPTARENEAHVSEALSLSGESASNLLYGAMLFGLVTVYILEQMLEKTETKLKKGQTDPNMGIFWAHLGTYTFYNTVTGFLLAEQRFEPGIAPFIYVGVIGLHFLTNDWVLREHFTKEFQHHGRILLGCSVLVGLGLGLVIPFNHLALGILESCVAGGLILNTIRDELPTFQKEGISSFLLGVVLYSSLLLSI